MRQPGITTSRLPDHRDPATGWHGRRDPRRRLAECNPCGRNALRSSRFSQPQAPAQPTAVPAAPAATPAAPAETDVVTLVLWYQNAANQDIIELYPIATDAGSVARPQQGAAALGTVDFPEEGVPTVSSAIRPSKRIHGPMASSSAGRGWTTLKAPAPRRWSCNSLDWTARTRTTSAPGPLSPGTKVAPEVCSPWCYDRRRRLPQTGPQRSRPPRTRPPLRQPPTKRQPRRTNPKLPSSLEPKS